MSFTITVAMPLVTLEPERYANACVLGITKDGQINIYTDFGNVILLDPEELFKRYKPSQSWLDFLEFGGVSESLYMRLDMQITLLKLAQSYITNGTNNDRSPR